MEYIVSIGLEIHIAIKTPFKAFSPDPSNSFSWISLGFPGTLPFLNYEAVEKTLKLSYLLGCEVNHENIVFDRKNYFYYDLPRGYQITQNFHPMGKNGKVTLSNKKVISIKQVHLEEDSAQQNKQGCSVRLSFNRLGKALIEVVTNPDFSSYEEIEEFLRHIRRVCNFGNISSASYEAGEMRIDLNISLRKPTSRKLSTKSEVKNLNSLLALKKSIDFLIKIQKDLLDSDQPIEGYTYAWVEKIQACEIMRRKRNAREYFYIPESNIPRLRISKEDFKKIISECKFNLNSIRDSFLEQGLAEKEVDYLLDNYEIYKWVVDLNKNINNLKVSFNWIATVVGMINNSENKEVDFREIEKTILKSESKEISQKLAKVILREIIVNKATYKSAVKKLKVSLVSDPVKIKKWVKEAFTKYKSQLPALLGNEAKLERLIIGECMKSSSGQADPLLTKNFFLEFLSVYKKQQD